MVEFWFDANFFIPVSGYREKVADLKNLIKFLHGRKFKLRITQRVREEVSFIDDIFRLYFKTIRIDNNTEFQNFCRDVRFAFTQIKRADQSLAFAASHSKDDSYIISNDEGFIRLKENRPEFMRKVKILEPTTFLARILVNIKNQTLKKKIESLIIFYADDFIDFLKKNSRPIERILKSLLVYSKKPILISEESSLPEEYENILERYVANESLNAQENLKIKPIKEFFNIFKEYNRSKKEPNHIQITKYLYLQFSEMISKLKSIEKSDKEDILNYSVGLQNFMESQLFKIRIYETINYFKDCLFDDAFFHFRPILEYDWNLDISEQVKVASKFIYGIFLLNLKDFALLEYLMESGFWKNFTQLEETFRTLLNIINEKPIDKIHLLFDEDLTFYYNLGQYFCNTGNPIGLKIFNTIFQLDLEKAENFDWYESFLKRYLLELRINQREITPEMKIRFLRFCDPEILEDNTRIKFDRSNELNEFTPIERCPYFYRQQFHIIGYEENKEFYEVFCWNENIKSIVLLEFPKKLCPNLKNIKWLQISKGKIKTKGIPFNLKKKARIIIKLNNDCNLKKKRFKINIKI